MIDLEAVLALWFGELDPNGLAAAAITRRWFRSTPAFDAAIRDRFGTWVDAASAGELDDWIAERLDSGAGSEDAARRARARIALIVLTDQFSRNIHRGTARAFAGDPLALRLALDGLATGDDARLPFAMRSFCYLPLEHAEDTSMQRTCVECFERLCAEAPSGPASAQAHDFLDHAREHRAIVERFGRFPHRNAALGRASTPAETEWLATARSFGQ